MPAYMIAEVEISSPRRFVRYQKLADVAVEKFSGDFIIRGGDQIALEGGWRPPVIVVLEFPSLDHIRNFYASPEYREAIRAREGVATMKILGVEGV